MLRPLARMTRIVVANSVVNKVVVKHIKRLSWGLHLHGNNTRLHGADHPVTNSVSGKPHASHFMRFTTIVLSPLKLPQRGRRGCLQLNSAIMRQPAADSFARAHRIIRR